VAKSSRRSFPPAPTHARALLLHAHPRRDSFNQALGAAWAEGARASGLAVEVVHLADLDFELRLDDGDEGPLEPDLIDLQARIADAAHLVIAAPVWWGSVPAVLKGFIDRTFQFGWAHGKDDKGNPTSGLTGRTGRLVMTMDAPRIWDRFMYGRSATRQLKDATLWYSGVKPTKVSMFAGIDSTTPARRAAMLESARKAGQKDAHALLKRLPAPVKAIAAR